MVHIKNKGWYRGLLVSVFTVILALTSMTASAAKTIVDLAGREVTLPAKVERILLGESRYIPALAILEGDQVFSRVAGMMGDLKIVDPDTYHQYQQAFPEIDKVPLFGKGASDSFSLETALALKADVAIFGIEGHGPSARNSDIIDILERAGVTVVFIDFRKNPMKNTTRSLAIMGEVLGREQRAQDYIAFYNAELAKVEKGLAALKGKPAPKVFLHSRVGLSNECCETMARGMVAQMLDFVGADNIAKPLIPGTVGVMNQEYLLTHQPDIYIGTAIGSTETLVEEPQYIVLGTSIDKGIAHRSLASITQQSPLKELTAVQNKRAYSIWHHFYNTPLNIVAVQTLAKWVYPQTFAALDPQATLQTLYQRYQPVPLAGTYWMAL
ncbi:iron ABC transporter substrate-binding protein [Photobacterium jeanii]|uniref:Iron ABC transporter substrate-binding protein n=1 Tax=Photobacterium jeanii TaxID=858640 RepID=A0A178K9M0_9GAMM|nr:ABC transporter substrate-binding protein [Photobacterium jeanii]OAN14049.1 iron ABC transporter substrate-binding protein [Photobacterium jeanii]PST86938.1 iron ABC transporter substrate-binding protein [Photobacterium jeanii]